MRYTAAFVSLSSLSSFARAVFPCEELCVRDGPSFCSEGSKAILNTEGIEICSNYYSGEDGSYTYSPENLPLNPLVLSDIPRLLAKIDLSLSQRVQPRDLFNDVANKLHQYAREHRYAILAEQLGTFARKSSPQGLLRTWEYLQGPRLLECLSERAQVTEIDPAAPFAFVSAGHFERGTEIEFSKASGLYDFCTRLQSYRKPFSALGQSVVARSFGRSLYEDSARARLQQNLQSAHLFCPQLLEDPFVAGALLSLKVRGNVHLSHKFRDTGSEDVMGLEDSIHLLNVTPIEMLQSGDLYDGVGNEAVWLTKMGSGFAADVDLLTFTDDAETLQRLDDKYRVFGRFLAYLLLNVVPAPMGALPRELLEGMLGNVANMRPGNFARIAEAFQEVVPIELSREFVGSVEVLETILRGMQKEEEILEMLEETVKAYSRCYEIDDLPFARGSITFCGLFDILYDLSPEEFRQFLYRVSGVAAVPLDGFERWGMAFSVEAISDVEEISVVVKRQEWVIRIPFSSFRTLEDFRDTILRFIHRGV